MTELVGREASFRRLASRLTATRGGDVVLVGVTGVGKTRLARALLDHLRNRSWRVDSAVASCSARSIPLGALAHLLPSREGLQPFDVLQRGLAVFGQDDSRRVLAVDDAHLLDEASAVMLHGLARQGGLRLLLTVRAGESVPDPITALWKDEGALRHELLPLSRRNTDLLATHLLGGPASTALLAALWRITHGNPLFVHELVQGTRDEDGLVLRGGRWHLLTPLSVSPRLTDLIETRLHGLPAEERDALELLALADPIDMSVLAELSGPSAVAALERRGLITVAQEGQRATLRAAHPLHTDVVRRGLPLIRQREQCGRLAEAHARSPMRRDGDLIRITLWRMTAGQEVDSEHCVAAGRQLLMADPAEAEALARAAAKRDGGFEAHLLLGEALARRRDQEADEQLARARDLARGDDELRRIVLAQASARFSAHGDAVGARQLLLEVVDRLVDHDARDEIEAAMALYASYGGEMEGAAAAADRTLARPDAGAATIVTTLTVSTVALAMLGRFDEVGEPLRLAQALEPQVRGDLPLARAQLLVNEAMWLAYGTSFADAARLLETAWDEAIEGEDAVTAGVLGATMVHVAALRGDLDTARRVAVEALPFLERRDPLSLHGLFVGHAAYTAALRGDRADAQRWLGRVKAAAEVRDPRTGFATTLARIRLLGLDGDLDGAAMTARAQAEVQAGSQPVWAALTAHQAVRLGRPTESVSLLSELADRCPQGVVPVLAEHAEADDAGNGARLEKVAESFAEMGAPRLAAEVQVQAARAHRRSRDVRGQARAMAEARRYGGLCGPPAPVGPADDLWMLTAREEEVAALAAAGHSNRRIAEQLSLSVRTVENHLGQVYGKLDLDGRGDLPGIFGTDC